MARRGVSPPPVGAPAGPRYLARSTPRLPPPVSIDSPTARVLLGAALAVLARLGGSLLPARFGQHRLMRWPAAVLIAAGIAAAVVFGVRGGVR